VQTPEATVVSSAHNFLRIGDVPVFYLPSLAHDINDREFALRSVRVGNSSKMGAFAETRWNAYQLVGVRSRHTDLDLMADHYSKRGLGLGLDFDYGTEGMFGNALTYFIEDSGDSDRNGAEVAKDHRGRFLWRHRSELGDGWRAEGEFSYLSDRGFLREYFEDEFQEGKDQETVLYLRKLDGNKGLRLQVDKQVNSFDTTVERQPGLNYDLIGQPLLGGFAVYTSSYDTAYLHREIDDELAARNPDRTVRFHTDQELAFPFALWAFRFSPYYKLQLTAADRGRDGDLPARLGRRRNSSNRRANTIAEQSAEERTVVGEDDSGAVYRHAHTVGLNTSTDF